MGSNTQETCCPLDDPFILVTYPHFICIANSFSTKKEDTHTGYPQKASTRRDSNPRPSPWQGDTPPLSHSRILICTFKTAHKLFILKTSVHKRTFTKPHFVLSLLRNSVLFMIVRSLRFTELSNSHASMKFSNSGTTCELSYHFLP